MNDVATPMSMPELVPTERAQSYITIMLDFLPLFGVAFGILVMRGIKVVRTAYLGQSPLAKFFGVIFSATIGAALSVGCGAIAPLIYPGASDSTVLGIVVFMSVGGVRVVDGLLYKHLGIHLVDASEQSENDKIWAELTEEEKTYILSHRKGEEE